MFGHTGIEGEKASICQMCPRLGSKHPSLLLIVALLPSTHFDRATAMCSGAAVLLAKICMIFKVLGSAKDKLAVILRGRLFNGEQI